MKKPPYVRPASEYPEIGLDYLHARCVESEGCLLWNMQMANGPITNIGRQTWKVRHLVYRLVHPRGPGKSHLPMPTVCGNERCVHPDHLTLVRRNSAVVGARRTLQHCINIAQAKRAKGAKVTLVQVHDIRTCGDTLQVMAARYGLSIAVLSRIRSGQSWKDYSNPFSQLIEASHAKAPASEAVDTRRAGHAAGPVPRQKQRSRGGSAGPDSQQRVPAGSRPGP